jgi:hypothetical protein
MFSVLVHQVFRCKVGILLCGAYVGMPQNQLEQGQCEC